ncbi:MAG: hypothetical protein M4D80_21435 [Myxococcota bacterium]|nr:hypothetical protein [Deltaproteobacteria bacterium]MDQ3337732.1 hypothetical protein [Myxococcota bacterium]
MIRFTANSDAGRILGLGLSHGNLRELRAERPIVFDLAQHESRGQLVIAYGDERTVAQMLALFPGGHVVTLTERTIRSLQGGEVIQVPLADLAVHNFRVGLLFAGETEYEIVTDMRTAGLIAPGARIDGIEEYERHERNEVSDCELCRARGHGAARPVIGPVTGEPWQERLYRHPYLFTIAFLVIVSIVVLLVQRLS